MNKVHRKTKLEKNEGKFGVLLLVAIINDTNKPKMRIKTNKKTKLRKIIALNSLEK